MSVLATILGGGKVIEKGLDLIDSFHTSKTEEIEAKTNAKVNLMQAYAPFKIAQRFLAIIFSTTYVISFFLVLSMTLYNGEGIKGVLNVIETFYLGPIVFTIVGFYFGGGVIEGALNARKQKTVIVKEIEKPKRNKQYKDEDDDDEF